MARSGRKGMKIYMCLLCARAFMIEREQTEQKGYGRNCPVCNIHHSFIRRMSKIEFLNYRSNKLKGREGEAGDVYQLETTDDGQVKFYHIKDI